MQYSIPEGYPEKLLPVKVKITSNHSVPSRRKTTLWPYTNLPVIYKDTGFDIVRNGEAQKVNPSNEFKYLYTMDNYDSSDGGHNMNYIIDWKITHTSSETNVPNCCFSGQNKMHTHLFLEGNFFGDYEMIVTFTNSVK